MPYSFHVLSWGTRRLEQVLAIFELGLAPSPKQWTVFNTGSTCGWWVNGALCAIDGAHTHTLWRATLWRHQTRLTGNFSENGCFYIILYHLNNKLHCVYIVYMCVRWFSIAMLMTEITLNLVQGIYNYPLKHDCGLGSFHLQLRLIPIVGSHLLWLRFEHFQ